MTNKERFGTLIAVTSLVFLSFGGFLIWEGVHTTENDKPMWIGLSSIITGFIVMGTASEYFKR